MLLVRVFLYVDSVCFFVFFFFVYVAIEIFSMNKVDYNSTGDWRRRDSV